VCCRAHEGGERPERTAPSSRNSKLILEGARLTGMSNQSRIDAIFRDN
jgi:hypothetical protein